jgi:hypothetical protein
MRFLSVGSAAAMRFDATTAATAPASDGTRPARSALRSRSAVTPPPEYCTCCTGASLVDAEAAALLDVWRSGLGGRVAFAAPGGRRPEPGRLGAEGGRLGPLEPPTAMEKLRIVILRFGTARQKRVLERWTNPKPLQHIWDRAAI